MDKDVELLKIQVYVDYCHSHYNGLIMLLMSITFSFFLTFTVLLIERLIYPLTFLFFVLLFILMFGGLGIRTFSVYIKHLEGVDKMIEMINEGEPLPSIKKLIRKEKVLLFG